jgi:segregation and condensation protein B
MNQSLQKILEAVLFASGEPISIKRLCEIVREPEEKILDAVDALTAEYEENKRGIRIIRLEDAYQMCSAPEYSEYVLHSNEQQKPAALTAAAMEALAVVAYFQPVTRSYISQIRGVDSSYTVSSLVGKGLIEPCGTMDAPGRPALYRTTQAFLRAMKLQSLEELPHLPDLKSSEGIEEIQKKIEALANTVSDESPNTITDEFQDTGDGEQKGEGEQWLA